jgi:hypothetical protein
VLAFLNKGPTSLLGLDISSTSVKLLELSRSGSEYRVESYGVEPLPENAVVEKNISDVEGVGEAIARLAERCKAKVTSKELTQIGQISQKWCLSDRSRGLGREYSTQHDGFTINTESDDKQELLIFITPRLIRDSVSSR